MGIGRDFVRRGLMWREHDLASAIDALVARRVEEERERCAELVDRAAARADGAEIDFDLLVDAIRATPPPLPSKETR